MNVALAEAAPGFDEAIVEAVRAFARRELHPLKIDAAAKIPEPVLEGLRGLGVFGLTLPAAHGGVGAGLPLATRVVRALAEVDRSVAVTVGLHLGLGTRALVRYGAPELQAELLPRLATGEWIAAFGTTEPGAGSDLSKLATRVVPEGAGLRLNGEKAYVTNAGIAGVLTVTATSPGIDGLEAGMTMVALRTGTPGLERLAEEHKLGLRGTSTCGFRLEEVKVPRRQLLGTPSTGKAQLEHTLSWGRTLMSAGCVGAASAALKLAEEHTRTRKQFGRPLIELPVVRGQLGRARVLVGAMDALVQTVAAQDDDAALHRWSVSAKVFCSEQAFSVIDTALQLHGGSGYIEATGLPMMLRDVRITRIFEGANDVLLTHAGALELQNPVPVPAGDGAARAICERVGRRVQRLRKELGVRAFRRPELLHQLGSAVVWRDAVISACQLEADPAWQAVLGREACAALRAEERRLHPAEDLELVLRRPS